MADQALEFPSLACFLKSLMDKHKGKSRGNLGRLVIAVHAAFLDSKFVISSDSNPLFGDQSPSSVLCYEIPNLVGPTAVVEFAVDGNEVTVTGHLSGGSVRSNAPRVCFDMLKLAAPLISSLHGAIGDSEERSILDFWKEVRSKLAFPLKVGIFHKNEIFLPPCFVCLPKDVKLRVLEMVPAFISAKIGCCCTELGFLCELDGMWRRKFQEEFGITSVWRKRYALGWLKERIADGDYGELLAGAKIDESGGQISVSLVANTDNVCPMNVVGANSIGRMLALTAAHSGLSAAEISERVLALVAARLSSAGQRVSMH